MLIVVNLSLSTNDIHFLFLKNIIIVHVVIHSLTSGQNLGVGMGLLTELGAYSFR